MKSILKSNSGFSLMEVVIAAGVAGIVGLVAVSFLRTNEKSINRVIETTESSFIKNLIIGNMSNPASCNNTFAMPTPQLINRASLTLFNKNAQAFLAPGQQISESRGTGTGSVKNIFTINTISSAAIAGTDKALRLSINYTIANTLVRDSKKVAKNFEVDVYIQRNAAGTSVTSCFIDTAEMIKKAIANSCKGNAAVYDAGANTCTHNVQFTGTQVTAGGALGTCPAGQFLKRSVTASGVTNFTCMAYTTAAPNCTSGTFMNGVNADGTPNCVAFATLFNTTGMVISATATGYQALNFNCADLPDGTQMVLRRYSSSGNDCVPKVIQKTCNAYEYISDVDSSGNVTCKPFTKNPSGACPAGTYARSVNADGSIPAGGCQAMTLPATCGAGYVINAIGSDGNVTSCIDRPY